MKVREKVRICILAALAPFMGIAVSIQHARFPEKDSINDLWIYGLLSVAVFVSIISAIWYDLPSDGKKPNITKDGIDGIINILQEWSDDFEE